MRDMTFTSIGSGFLRVRTTCHSIMSQDMRKMKKPIPGYALIVYSPAGLIPALYNSSSEDMLIALARKNSIRIRPKTTIDHWITLYVL